MESYKKDPRALIQEPIAPMARIYNLFSPSLTWLFFNGFSLGKLIFQEEAMEKHF